MTIFGDEKAYGIIKPKSCVKMSSPCKWESREKAKELDSFFCGKDVLE
jgi:hypothetical protein